MPLGPVHHHRDFPAAALADLKGDRTISVCIPARDEADTIAVIVETLRRDLVESVALVDELIVVDDHSLDTTADLAVAAGAKVVPAASVMPELTGGPGKGQALWKSVLCSSGDLIVWCDADIRDFDSHFVSGVIGPLLHHDEVAFVKAFYERPEVGSVGGGRVTELMARPLLSTFFPALAPVVQPLAGEFAIRRSVAEQMRFAYGYGVEVGLLIDVAARFGEEAVSQVDLDRRVDRNRPLSYLGPQAFEVLRAVLARADVAIPETAGLLRPGEPPRVADPPDLAPPSEI